MHKWTHLTAKIKDIYKEEKVGKQGDMSFGRARKPRLHWFYFLLGDSGYLFVFDSWYCKIKTTRLYLIKYAYSSFISFFKIFYSFIS